MSGTPAGDGLPDYDELPELEGLDVKHSRGLLPAGRATLAFITPAAVARASASVTEGLSLGLNLAVDAFDPPLFGRSPLTHTVIEPTRNDAEDVIDGFNPQASSQLDGLAHVRARDAGYYDGSTSLDEARENLGMQHWAATGIAARGVLIDVPGYFEAVGRDYAPFSGLAITPALLHEVADHQGVSFEPGDVVLVRTRWAADFLALPPEERADVTGWNGLVASHEMAAHLWNTRTALIGSDNPAVENAPGDRAIGSLHRRMLPGLGLSFLELLDLERLAAECARLRRYAFLFVSVPLNLHGAVSSPSNALAVL